MSSSNFDIGRFPILRTWPQVDDGRFPVKAFSSEVLEFGATATREGHDQLGVDLLLTSPSGQVIRKPMTPGSMGSDSWLVKHQLDEVGIWSYQISAYDDRFGTWLHDTEIKLEAGVDSELMLLEGSRLLREISKSSGKPDQKAFGAIDKLFADASIEPLMRFRRALELGLVDLARRNPSHHSETLSPRIEILCERVAAGSASWYEFFPRSEGAKKTGPDSWTSGNFKTAKASLKRVSEMGFEVLYLPPIHPIGKTHRKGPNNTLTATENDPGSPWAIGSEKGGHDTIHPDLGTEKDFKAFVAAANKLGIEVALDLALQASPDHPWVTQHPNWFKQLADGSIAYAENPPKKYQDIYPIYFDDDPEGIRAEVLSILKKWIGLGVRIFRVDNPHTKPASFWQKLIAEIQDFDSSVIFLAEAFTRPAMMAALGKVGFQQSYTYFTWRNNKSELEDYLRELSQVSADYFRPNLWVNTPDILTSYLQFGGHPAFKIRATIAATAGASWGMYAGYELYEAVARPGAEEAIDNEKFEIKFRDFEGAAERDKSLAPRIALLNQIRRQNPAIRQLRNLILHDSEDPEILVYSKSLEAEFNQGTPNTVIVVVNTDPRSVRETMVLIDLEKLNLPEAFMVEDMITGKRFEWGARNYVKLDSFDEPAHILRVIP